MADWRGSRVTPDARDRSVAQNIQPVAARTTRECGGPWNRLACRNPRPRERVIWRQSAAADRAGDRIEGPLGFLAMPIDLLSARDSPTILRAHDALLQYRVSPPNCCVHRPQLSVVGARASWCRRQRHEIAARPRHQIERGGLECERRRPRTTECATMMPRLSVASRTGLKPRGADCLPDAVLCVYLARTARSPAGVQAMICAIGPEPRARRRRRALPVGRTQTRGETMDNLPDVKVHRPEVVMGRAREDSLVAGGQHLGKSRSRADPHPAKISPTPFAVASCRMRFGSPGCVCSPMQHVR